MVPKELVLCDPDTRDPLTFGQSPSGPAALQSCSGRTFPIDDDIIKFCDDTQLPASVRELQHFYDRLAPWYDLGSFVHLLISPSTRHWRTECLRELPLTPETRVLEIGVGTGANMLRMPPVAEFFGVDLSMGMLRRCRRKRAAARSVTLCHALAESLPFGDHTMDVVFHAGDINVCRDRRRVLEEMTRVARPGAALVVVDATERFALRHAKTPLLASVYHGRPVAFDPPTDILPSDVVDTHVKAIAAGELYCLSFRKALAPARR